MQRIEHFGENEEFIKGMLGDKIESILALDFIRPESLKVSFRKFRLHPVDSEWSLKGFVLFCLFYIRALC